MSCRTFDDSLPYSVKDLGLWGQGRALACHTLILFWELLVKGNHYETKVYTVFSLVTSKPSDSRVVSPRFAVKGWVFPCSGFSMHST